MGAPYLCIEQWRGSDPRRLTRQTMKLCLSTSLAPLAVLLLILLSACRKEPMAPPATGTPVDIPADWSACAQIPARMTVLLYTESGDLVRTVTSTHTDLVRVQLPEGKYRPRLISYSPSEWKSLRLTGLDSWDGFRVRPTRDEPSVLAFAEGQPFTVIKGFPLRIRPLAAREVVHNLQVQVYIDGIRHLGSISGSLRPQDTSLPEETIPLPPEAWEIDGKASVNRNILDASAADAASLHLLMRYPDGAVALDTLLDIRGGIQTLPSGHYSLRIGTGEAGRIRIPAPQDGGSGPFAADIREWEPGEETEYLFQ